MKMRVHEMKTKLKGRGWFMVQGEMVPPITQRLRHKSIAGPIDLPENDMDELSEHAIHSIYRRARIIR